MRNLIIRNLKGKVIIPLFLLAGIFYAIMMTVTIPKVMSFSGGMKILDMMPTGYSAGYADQLMKTLGDEGRHVYLCHQIPLDMIYPLLFGISCCLILAFFLKNIGKSEGPLYYLCLLPLIAGLFDYLENIGIITMLKIYPADIASIAKITNVFSILKSFSTTVYFSILIILLIIIVIRKTLFKTS